MTAAAGFAGVDGCPAGWIAVLRGAGRPPECAIFAAFADILDVARIIAVDMPIGLPERTGHGGRGPENAVRPHLGARQSSVFSVPSRAAVMTPDYRAACAAALETSDPPRRVSKQCFNLFPKIREIDAIMTCDLESRVYEVHPELAFWRLNGGQPMALPKKVKSRPNPAGLDERRALLCRYGYDADFLATPPTGAGADDLLDAAVNALIAERIATGAATAVSRRLPARRQRVADGDLGLSHSGPVKPATAVWQNLSVVFARFMRAIHWPCGRRKRMRFQTNALTRTNCQWATRINRVATPRGRRLGSPLPLVGRGQGWGSRQHNPIQPEKRWTAWMNRVVTLDVVATQRNL